jgi:hypothetical protein
MVNARPKRVHRQVMGSPRGRYEVGVRWAHISLEIWTHWLNHPPDNVLAAIFLAPVQMTTQAASASISLIRVVDWDGTSGDIKQVLTAAFEAEDYLDCIKNLRARNIEPLSYIDSLDKVGSCSILEGTLDSLRFGDRSSTTFGPTQIYKSDAYER